MALVTLLNAPWIFVSYRRATDAHWGAWVIAQEVEKQLGSGSVFLDAASIKSGSAWADAIRLALSQCDLMLVIIDRSWHEHLTQDGDWVREEIRTALAREVRILPVLLEGSQMPRETDLPNDISRLASFQAVHIDGRSRESLAGTVGALTKSILSFGTAQLSFDRKPSGIRFDGMQMTLNSWRLFVNDREVISLEDGKESATVALAFGSYRLHATWGERQWSHPRTGPGYWSHGITAPLELRIRPGIYGFSLKRGVEERRGFWRELWGFFSMEDRAPRTLELVSFAPVSLSRL